MSTARGTPRNTNIPAAGSGIFQQSTNHDSENTPPPRNTPSRAGIFLAAPLEHPSHATTGRRPRARGVAVPPARTTAWRHARGRARRGSGLDAGADSTRRRRARRDAMRCDAVVAARRGARRRDASVVRRGRRAMARRVVAWRLARARARRLSSRRQRVVVVVVVVVINHPSSFSAVTIECS